MKLVRRIEHTARYLSLPVANDRPSRRVRLLVGEATVRQFDIKLAAGEPDFAVYADVGEWVGEPLTIEVTGEDIESGILDSITNTDLVAASEDLYLEPHRPQFHFTSRRGWNNDPNGLMYFGGEYHLFYQHNPYGWRWGNMHWGHAISRDLVHWQELGDALYPDHLGTCFSGSGVVDWQNAAGFQDGETRAMVCMYTSAGGIAPESADQPFTQSLAYSTDKGRTWHKHDGNPVVGHIVGRNRDPKVIWHEPSERWVMALYLEGNRYGLHTSVDLRRWDRLDEIELPGCSECPDIFELPVDDDTGNTRWVFWGANGAYALGDFDGSTFRQDGATQRFDWGGHSYAAQTWSDIPAADGRRIQIAWLRVSLPGSPFNQQMTFPCELSLRSTPEGIRLASLPVREIALLHKGSYVWRELSLPPGTNWLAEIEGDLFDIEAQFEISDTQQFGFFLRGIPVLYDGHKKQLVCAGQTAPLEPIDGSIRLRVLVDRASIEVFGNDGLVAIPLGVIPSESNRSLEVFCRGGEVRVSCLRVHELRSAWS